MYQMAQHAELLSEYNSRHMIIFPWLNLCVMSLPVCRTPGLVREIFCVSSYKIFKSEMPNFTSSSGEMFGSGVLWAKAFYGKVLFFLCVFILVQDTDICKLFLEKNWSGEKMPQVEVC